MAAIDVYCSLGSTFLERIIQIAISISFHITGSTICERIEATSCFSSWVQNALFLICDNESCVAWWILRVCWEYLSQIAGGCVFRNSFRSPGRGGSFFIWDTCFSKGIEEFLILLDYFNINNIYCKVFMFIIYKKCNFYKHSRNNHHSP